MLTGFKWYNPPNSIKKTLFLRKKRKNKGKILEKNWK